MHSHTQAPTAHLHRHTQTHTDIPQMPCGHPEGQQGLREPHGHWQPSPSPSQVCFGPCLLAALAQCCRVHTEAGSIPGPPHHTAAQIEHDSWEIQYKECPKMTVSIQTRIESWAWRPDIFVFLLFLYLPESKNPSHRFGLQNVYFLGHVITWEYHWLRTFT